MRGSQLLLGNIHIVLSFLHKHSGKKNSSKTPGDCISKCQFSPEPAWACHVPMILSLELLPQEHRCVAHTLLDDPSSLHDAGYELEDAVPPGVVRYIVASKKSVQASICRLP